MPPPLAPGGAEYPGGTNSVLRVTNRSTVTEQIPPATEVAAPAGGLVTAVLAVVADTTLRLETTTFPRQPEVKKLYLVLETKYSGWPTVSRQKTNSL